MSRKTMEYRLQSYTGYGPELPQIPKEAAEKAKELDALIQKTHAHNEIRFYHPMSEGDIESIEESFGLLQSVKEKLEFIINNKYLLHNLGQIDLKEATDEDATTELEDELSEFVEFVESEGYTVQRGNRVNPNLRYREPKDEYPVVDCNRKRLRFGVDGVTITIHERKSFLVNRNKLLGREGCAKAGMKRSLLRELYLKESDPRAKHYRTLYFATFH